MRCVLPHQGLVHDETTGAQDHAFERADELVAAFAADHQADNAIAGIDDQRHCARVETHVDFQIGNTLGEHVHQILAAAQRSEEHTSELQSLMRISYAVFCLKKKQDTQTKN